MKRKVLIAVIVLLFVSVLFVGCGGKSGSSVNPQENKPKTATLVIRVTDGNGSPIDSAGVTVYGSKVTTNSNGEVTVKNLKPGNYTVDVEKEGYENASEDVNILAGDSKRVAFTLDKKENTDTLKSLSKLKSYKATIEMKSENSNDSSKTVMIQDDYGKSERITVYGKDGKVQLDVYVVGDKAKMKSGDGDKWQNLPANSAQMFTKTAIQFAEGVMNSTTKEYNDTIIGKDSAYSIKREGSETMNGYRTNKYHISAKVTSGKDKGHMDAYIWVINSGSYKDYTTRMEVTTLSSEDGKAVLDINLTGIGKDMHISMP